MIFAKTPFLQKSPTAHRSEVISTFPLGIIDLSCNFNFYKKFCYKNKNFFNRKL